MNMHDEYQPVKESTIFGLELVRASAGKRLANYLIDTIVFYVVYLAGYIVVGFVFPAILESEDTYSSGASFLDQVIAMGLYAVFMGAVEALFEGRSFGKVITKTKAVNFDGSRISTMTAFRRGFCRAVPFVVFSALGTPCIPWQDKWTNTVVIDEKMSFGYDGKK